ncbi:MAG: hypothetical protein L0Y39_10540, partial [Methylococcaceae bacterium]|nr:hypothetical protein [Methylococcaceae bacterium]
MTDPIQRVNHSTRKTSASDPRSGKTRRHHIDGKVLQRAVKDAIRAARIAEPASCHTLCHSFCDASAKNAGLSTDARRFCVI